MRSLAEVNANVPAFLGKLWKMVNDIETNHLISWSPSGKTFIIKNQAEFAPELLPLYYKHNNMASFIRQLNMYGFHKITSVDNGGLRYEKDEIEFSHPCFMKGHAYLLSHIKRKIANPKAIVTTNDGADKILYKPEAMNKVLADVKQMKGKQESIDAKFSAMKQENEALWREVAILRQKHTKQQQIVNNLIQFLMSLVQAPRQTNNPNTNVGVKRPLQLMINNAAHNGGGPHKAKNIKLDKESLLEEINEDNVEDGPTIHELAYDDMLHNETSQDHMDIGNYVSIELSPGATTLTDPSAALQYQVTMEDGEETDSGVAPTMTLYPIAQTNSSVRIDAVPNVTSPSAPEPIGTEQIMTQVMAAPSTSKPKNRPSVANKGVKSNKSLLMNSSNFNAINPSADLKLPAEIFASDDSVSDAGFIAPEELLSPNTLQEHYQTSNLSDSDTKDKMVGGLNIKLEKPAMMSKASSKKSDKVSKNNMEQINLADIKTELQDDLDWNNMTLATVNNITNMDRFQNRIRRDNIVKSREEYASLFGTSPHKNDIDDHLESMQTDLDSLRELLRSDSYSLDTNTLMGINKPNMAAVHHLPPHSFQLFGSEDPFYGLSYNSMEDKTKTPNNAKKQRGGIANTSGDEEYADNLGIEEDVEGNQLISYTGNVPDFEYISLPELEAEESTAGCESTLNTPVAISHSTP